MPRSLSFAKIKLLNTVCKVLERDIAEPGSVSEEALCFANSILDFLTTQNPDFWVDEF